MISLRSSGSALLVASALALARLTASSSAAPAVPQLKVSDDGHFLVHADGTPFFYLADTAWELFHRLNREDAGFYLSNRAAKGFTVIQAVVLGEFAGLTEPNADGQLPLIDQDLARPNPAYFEHVDWIVNKAADLGLFVAMLPAWGDKWNRKWGLGPEIFTPDNAEEFGRFLGKRYRDKPIIWVLGGDRNPESNQHLSIIRALAKGLERGDDGQPLMTFHPMGAGNSAQWFHPDRWLQFHMIQSGHAARDLPNYESILANSQLNPPKPVLDGEPCYEDHPINWKPENGWFDDADARQALYWSLLAGACGHTYGNHNVWQFWQSGRKPVSSARTPWRVALDQPGAFQAGFARRLFLSRPFLQLRPDHNILLSPNPAGAGHLQAARATDGSYLYVYTPAGEPFRLTLKNLPAGKLKALWFDPRRGLTLPSSSLESGTDASFQPPSRGRGHDWLLIIEDPSKNYPEFPE